jgi:hypothetical protein
MSEVYARVELREELLKSSSSTPQRSSPEGSGEGREGRPYEGESAFEEDLEEEAEEVEEARALKSVMCPRCGREGILKASRSNASSLVYVEHVEDASGKIVRARCYLGRLARRSRTLELEP